MTETDNFSWVDEWVRDAGERSRLLGRPLILLSFAQSLDGSLTAVRGRPTALSGTEAMGLTHLLRSRFDALLIGVGTLLSDDPQLTVRLVEGRNPQAVILDSRLRTPFECRLMRRQTDLPWIVCAASVESSRRKRFEEHGVRLIPVPRKGDAGLDLQTLMPELLGLGIRTLMVEGGAGVLHSFMAGGLVDEVVITISPRWLQGLPAVSGHSRLPHLVEPVYQILGKDMIVRGRLDWEAL